MNLLVTGALPLTTEEREAFERLGYAVTVHPDERVPVEHPERYEAVICNGLFLHQDEAAFSALRAVQLTSAGLDRVPMDRLTKRGVTVFNARGVYSIPMAEFAVGGVLSLLKESRFFYRNQQEKKWEKHRGLTELFKSTVCIVGCGSVGTECAKRFQAFGCRCLGVDVQPLRTEGFESVAPLSALGRTLSQSDIVVLTLPLTEQTRGLFDARRIRDIKEGAILVNLARGAVLEEEALIGALQTGRLRGAVLDVFLNEPLEASSPLWEMEQVLVTPHNSFVSDRTHGRMVETALYNLERGVR